LDGLGPHLSCSSLRVSLIGCDAEMPLPVISVERRSPQPALHSVTGCSRSRLHVAGGERSGSAPEHSWAGGARKSVSSIRLAFASELLADLPDLLS
jgi:hypothetical protein